MRRYLIAMAFVGAVIAQPASAEDSQQIGYLHRLCGLVAGGALNEKLALPESAFKIIKGKSYIEDKTVPVIALDPSVHPDGALACVPLASPGMNWPSGGLYIYKDGAIRAKLTNTTTGFRLGITKDTASMSRSKSNEGDADTDAAIYGTIGWSEFDMVSEGGFFGGAVAEGNAREIFRGLDRLRDGGSVYFEFKSPSGVGRNSWQPFYVDMLGYRSRADVTALWEAIEWKR